MTRGNRQLQSHVIMCLYQCIRRASRCFRSHSFTVQRSRAGTCGCCRPWAAWLLPLVCLAWAWWFAAQPAQAQSGAESAQALHLADQRLADARLIDITEQGEFTFQLGAQTGAQTGSQAGAATRSFAGRQIVRWGRQRASAGSALVWLADGSWLAGQLQWKSEQQFELISDWFAPIELQINQVRGLVLQPPVSLKRFGELEKRMQRVTGSADAIWNARSEQLSGVLTLELRPAVEAELPPSPVWVLKTSASAEPIELESDAVQAIVFSPILRRSVRPPEGTVHLDLRDGSRLNVTAITRSAKGSLQLALADNRLLEALDSSTQFASAVARITAEPQGITWLGALEPARYRFAQQSGELTWPLGRNQDLFGQPLSLGGEAVPHGLAMHAPSQAAYRWDGRPAKFLAEVSLYRVADGLPTPVGSAECKVLVARQGKLVEIFRSPVLRATTPAVPIELDVSDAQLVVLLVEQADQGPVGDHVLWREARLAPAAESPSSKK